MNTIEFKDQLKEQIISHDLYNHLDEVDKRVILSDVYIHWLYNVFDLLSRDRQRTILLVTDHQHIIESFKPIYLDLLNNAS